VRERSTSFSFRTGKILPGIIGVILLIGLTACYRNYTTVARHDYSTYYSPDKTKALPAYVIYNLNDSVSRLYFSVKSSDLLYERSNVNNQLTAHILVGYILRPIGETKTVTDSGHVVLNDVNDNGVARQLAGFVDFDVPRNGSYYMEVTLRDLNKMTISYELLILEHNGTDARNNFTLTQPGGETPLFRNYVGENELFSLRYYQKETTKFYVRYFKNISDAARPPYAFPMAAPDYLPDSSWTIDLADPDTLRFKAEGSYFISTTANSASGYAICRFPPNYPKITTPTSLLEPLRYITTKKEYVTLETSANRKTAIDSFWLSLGGSQERARELISAFYGRVEIANTHFSSTKEGWKNDRGMVYIIYGEPQNVYRSWKSETWVYGQDQSGNMLTFVFNRNMTSFAANEFELERNQVYQIGWITAVDYWKQGQVYRAK